MLNTLKAIFLPWLVIREQRADIERRRLASIDMGFAVERLEKQLAKKAA